MTLSAMPSGGVVGVALSPSRGALPFASALPLASAGSARRAAAALGAGRAGEHFAGFEGTGLGAALCASQVAGSSKRTCANARRQHASSPRSRALRSAVGALSADEWAVSSGARTAARVRLPKQRWATAGTRRALACLELGASVEFGDLGRPESNCASDTSRPAAARRESAPSEQQIAAAPSTVKERRCRRMASCGVVLGVLRGMLWRGVAWRRQGRSKQQAAGWYSRGRHGLARPQESRRRGASRARPPRPLCLSPEAPGTWA